MKVLFVAKASEIYLAPVSHIWFELKSIVFIVKASDKYLALLSPFDFYSNSSLLIKN